MLRIILLVVMLFMSVSCSSESEKPAVDIKIPLVSNDLVKLGEELQSFGAVNDLYVLENDRGQMQVLNGGKPAISFWFSFAENEKTAINVTTVNEGDFMRVMIFSSAFRDAEHMNNVQKSFLEKFEK